MRKTALFLVVAAALVFSAPNAASAADESTDYGPDEPRTPTLAGSTVSPACDADVPWITYSIVLTDPDDQSTGDTAQLTLTDGSSSVTLPLGTLGPDGTLTGSVLWPGASVDGNGNGNGWPGWVFQNGEWVQTSGNYAWTRGDISATIQVNPEISVMLSYPQATTDCAVSPSVTGTPSGLAVTGGQSDALLPLAAGGGAALLLGAGLYAARRRHARS